MRYASAVTQSADDETHMRDRILDGRIALALGLYSLGVVAALLVAGMRVTYDDGFYYFKIAQQIASGAGSTFDGVHPTNGYHPLWLLCLVPVFWLAPAPDSALVIGGALQGLLMAAGTILLYHIGRLSFGRFAASLAVLVWVVCTYRLAVSGLEFSLHALGLLAAVYVYLRWLGPIAYARAEPPRLRCYVALGLLLSATFLARIDTLLLAVVLGLALGWRELQRGLTRAGIARLLAFGAPLLVVCTAYAWANLWLFGYPLPVSGAVKQTWSAYLLAQDPRYQTGGWLAAKADHLLWPFADLAENLRGLFPLAGGGLRGSFSAVLYSSYIVVGTFGVGGVFVAAALGRWYGPWRRWFRRTLWPWGPFVLFSQFQLLSYALLYHANLSITTWYYVIQPCLMVILIAALADWVVSCWVAASRRGQRNHAAMQEGFTKRSISSRSFAWLRGFLLPIMLLGWFSVAVYPLWSFRQWYELRRVGLLRQPLYDMAEWVSASVPPDAVVGAWNAGTLSYMSGRRVVNLDGLVNSWHYQQAERYDLCSYWQATGIGYLADSFADRRAVSIVPMYPSYAACADRLELVWAESGSSPYGRTEVYRIRPPDEEAAATYETHEQLVQK
jgi:hypothetical protein